MYKFPENYLPYIIGLMIFYALSRLTEFLDHQIYETLHFISGHTLKHLFATVGTYCVLKMLQKRTNLEDPLT